MITMDQARLKGPPAIRGIDKMLRAEATDIYDLNLTGDAVERNYDRPTALSGKDYSVFASPVSCNNLAMLEALRDAVSPPIHRLFANGYRPWLFLVGAPLTAEKKAAIKVYDLAGPARKKDFLGSLQLSKTFLSGSYEREAGFYEIVGRRLCSALEFAISNSWSRIIFSDRPDFLGDECLTETFAAARSETPDMKLVAMNWKAVACSLCRQGDIILNVWIGDGELTRTAQFIAAPKVFPALGD